MTAPPPPIRVNRAPVLTLWAAVVAGRLGHPPDTALSLASAVAGTAARAKARRLGFSEERDHAKAAAPARAKDTAQLLGKKIRLTHDANGVVLAEGEGKPAPAAPVQAYVTKAFGEHLAAVRKTMEDLAAQYEPEKLNRIGFRLYEAFRPEVPSDVKGWGAKGILDLAKIRDAAA